MGMPNVAAWDAHHGRIDAHASSRAVKVGNPNGLHLRACYEIAKAAERHQAKVTLPKGAQSANAESILDLLTLAVACGEELVLSATGVEAQKAVTVLASLLTKNSE